MAVARASAASFVDYAQDDLVVGAREWRAREHLLLRRVSATTLERLRQAYSSDRVTRNGKHGLTQATFVRVMLHSMEVDVELHPTLRVEGTSQPAASPELVAQLMLLYEAMDVNADGLLEWEELLSFVLQPTDAVNAGSSEGGGAAMCSCSPSLCTCGAAGGTFRYYAGPSVDTTMLHAKQGDNGNSTAAAGLPAPEDCYDSLQEMHTITWTGVLAYRRGGSCVSVCSWAAERYTPYLHTLARLRHEGAMYPYAVTAATYIPLTSTVATVALRADSRRVCMCIGMCVCPSTHVRVTLFRLPRGISSFSPSNDGGADAASVDAMEARIRMDTHTLAFASDVILYEPCTKRIYAFARMMGALMGFDGVTGKPVWEEPHEFGDAGVSAAAVISDRMAAAAQLVSASASTTSLMPCVPIVLGLNNGRIVGFCARTLTQRHDMDVVAHAHGVRCLAYEPESTMLVSVGRVRASSQSMGSRGVAKGDSTANVLLLWNLKPWLDASEHAAPPVVPAARANCNDGIIPRQLHGHAAPPSSVTISASAHGATAEAALRTVQIPHLVSGDESGVIIVWDVVALAPRQRIFVHGEPQASRPLAAEHVDDHDDAEPSDGRAPEAMVLQTRARNPQQRRSLPGGTIMSPTYAVVTREMVGFPVTSAAPGDAPRLTRRRSSALLLEKGQPPLQSPPRRRRMSYGSAAVSLYERHTEAPGGVHASVAAMLRVGQLQSMTPGGHAITRTITRLGAAAAAGYIPKGDCFPLSAAAPLQHRRNSLPPLHNQRRSAAAPPQAAALAAAAHIPARAVTVSSISDFAVRLQVASNDRMEAEASAMEVTLADGVQRARELAHTVAQSPRPPPRSWMDGDTIASSVATHPRMPPVHDNRTNEQVEQDISDALLLLEKALASATPVSAAVMDAPTAAAAGSSQNSAGVSSIHLANGISALVIATVPCGVNGESQSLLLAGGANIRGARSCIMQRGSAPVTSLAAAVDGIEEPDVQMPAPGTVLHSHALALWYWTQVPIMRSAVLAACYFPAAHTVVTVTATAAISYDVLTGLPQAFAPSYALTFGGADITAACAEDGLYDEDADPTGCASAHAVAGRQLVMIGDAGGHIHAIDALTLRRMKALDDAAYAASVAARMARRSNVDSAARMAGSDPVHHITSITAARVPRTRAVVMATAANAPLWISDNSTLTGALPQDAVHTLTSVLMLPTLAAVPAAVREADDDGLHGRIACATVDERCGIVAIAMHAAPHVIAAHLPAHHPLLHKSASERHMLLFYDLARTSLQAMGANTSSNTPCGSALPPPVHAHCAICCSACREGEASPGASLAVLFMPAITSMRILPAQAALLTAHDNGSVCVWALPPHELPFTLRMTWRVPARVARLPPALTSKALRVLISGHIQQRIKLLQVKDDAEHTTDARIARDVATATAAAAAAQLGARVHGDEDTSDDTIGLAAAGSTFNEGVYSRHVTCIVAEAAAETQAMTRGSLAPTGHVQYSAHDGDISMIVWLGDSTGEIHRYFISSAAWRRANMTSTSRPTYGSRPTTSGGIAAPSSSAARTGTSADKLLMLMNSAVTRATALHATATPCVVPDSSRPSSAAASACSLLLEVVPAAQRVELTGPVWEGSWRAHGDGDACITTLAYMSGASPPLLLSAAYDGLTRMWDSEGRLWGTLDPQPSCWPAPQRNAPAADPVPDVAAVGVGVGSGDAFDASSMLHVAVRRVFDARVAVLDDRLRAASAASDDGFDEWRGHAGAVVIAATVPVPLEALLRQMSDITAADAPQLAHIASGVTQLLAAVLYQRRLPGLRYSDAMIGAPKPTHVQWHPRWDLRQIITHQHEDATQLLAEIHSAPARPLRSSHARARTASEPFVLPARIESGAADAKGRVAVLNALCRLNEGRGAGREVLAQATPFSPGSPSVDLAIGGDLSALEDILMPRSPTPRSSAASATPPRSDTIRKALRRYSLPPGERARRM